MVAIHGLVILEANKHILDLDMEDYESLVLIMQKRRPR